MNTPGETGRVTDEQARHAAPDDVVTPDMKSETEDQAIRFALGLGLTNECNLACAFCYRDPSRVDRLTLEQVRAVLERLPVRSVNLGTGENGMHPDFRPILQYLRGQPVKLTITSNGHSIAVLDDEDVRAFHDVEFSLDYPTEAEQDAQRGAGNWALVHEQAARCRRLNVPITIIAVMMKSNYLRLAEVARVAKRFDAPLRINVYQSVRSDAYALTYEEYWEGFRCLFAETEVIDIGEPLVRAFVGLPPRTSGVRGGAHAAARLRAVRVSRTLRRRLRGPPPASWRARPTRFLLPHRPRRMPHAPDHDGCCSRLAQNGKRLHHHRHRPLTPHRSPSLRRQTLTKPDGTFDNSPPLHPIDRGSRVMSAPVASNSHRNGLSCVFRRDTKLLAVRRGVEVNHD
ncbi:MAG: radical SAM protein [Acidobacteria bacterium]|nr:radical SAM protein [Acidobacteriota bacterium]